MYFARPLKQLLASNPKNVPQYAISLKNKSGEDLQCVDPRALRSLILLMDQSAVNGGAAAHWGGPSALSELVSALHALIFKKSPWYESYNLVNDIGHAENVFYAVRALYQFAELSIDELKKFRSFPSRLTGHGESHLFAEAVQLSNGPLGSAFPQSQGLAAADKLLGNQRTTICFLSDGAIMEGEAKEALSAIPGLAGKSKLNPYLLIVSYNNTKLSGRIHQDAYDLYPSLKALRDFGWDVVEVQEGHSLKACLEVLDESLEFVRKNPQKPRLLLVHTVKGQGLKKTQESASGGHGYPLKKYDVELKNFLQEIWQGETVPAVLQAWCDEVVQNSATSSSAGENVSKEKIQAGFGRAMIAARQKNIPIISISADLQSSTGVAPFHKEFPQFSFDVGVAEANMINMAAGCSKLGFIPVVDTFAAFGVTKGNLPLIMASLSQAPVIAAFSHVGFQDAADGASHQSLTYFSALAAIPQLEIVSPANAQEAQELLNFAIERQSNNQSGKTPSTIFVTGREDAPKELPFGQPWSWGAPRMLKAGSQGVIVSSGNLLGEAFQAALLLEQEGKQWSVVSHAFLNHIDLNAWEDIIRKNNGCIITVEDHQVKAGWGSYLVSTLTQKHPQLIKKCVLLGVDGVFGQSAYDAHTLYQYHKLDARSIAKIAREMLV